MLDKSSVSSLRRTPAARPEISLAHHSFSPAHTPGYKVVYTGNVSARNSGISYRPDSIIRMWLMRVAGAAHGKRRALLFLACVLLHLSSRKASALSVHGSLRMQRGDGKQDAQLQPSLLSYQTATTCSALQFAAGLVVKAPLSEMALSSLTTAVYSLLSGAEERQRLDANTFKIAGAGCGLSAALALMLQQKRIWQRLGSVVFLVVSLVQLRRFGLPQLRVEWAGANFTSRAYLLSALPSLFVLAKTIPAAVPICLAAHLALHCAANVGAKRLASETYQKLNDVLMAMQAAACVIVSASPTTTVRDVAAVLVAGLPVLAACTRGKALGLSYTNAATPTESQTKS